MRRLAFFSILLAVVTPGFAQSAQKGDDTRQRATDTLALEYLHYRPARWEKDQVVEFENEFPNEGGLLHLYLRNTGDKPVQLRYWRANRHDRSYWVLNHLVSWDRLYNSTIAPGQMAVLEINAVSSDFAPGAPLRLNYMDEDGRNLMNFKGTLEEGPARISNLHVFPDMQTITVHVRSTDPAAALSIAEVTVEGREATTLSTLSMPGAAVARVKLAAPMAPGELLIVRAKVGQGESTTTLFGHRRAYGDVFPVGVWSVNQETAPMLQAMHIDTAVAGGSARDGFYDWGLRAGLRNMVHSGVPTSVDRVREVKDKPSVLCWMLTDEPDWSTPANIILQTDQHIRDYDTSKPTMVTLCRNIKFMEYASIADIPCQDHYSVTAPSSSKWPKPYGTRLEETGYYTRDLKYASEPKPVWVWSQGIGDWGQRPKRPMPTPNEIAAQLSFNLGRGAKGILWFNHSKSLHEKWPDAVEAMTRWSAVMHAVKADILDSDPWAAPGIAAPEGVDVAPLLGLESALLFLTNTRYEIHPEAYPFEAFAQVELSIPWNRPAPAKAVRVEAEGEQPLEAKLENCVLSIPTGPLEAAAVLKLVL